MLPANRRRATAFPCDIQVNLLRLSTIVVCQQPSGVKASLQRSLAAIPADRMDARPVERSRLYFLLAWLHAVVQERLRYAPFGWTKAYEFSDADQRVGLDAIDIWLVRVLCVVGRAPGHVSVTHAGCVHAPSPTRAG